MLIRLLNLIFGSKNERELKRLQPLVAQINDMESSLQALSQEALAEKTQTLKMRLEAGDTLDDILPEAFAVCREASQTNSMVLHW